MIICGNCRDRHASVDDVRDCYEATAATDADAMIERRYEQRIESPEAYGLARS
jgi:hypothetical protein